MAETFWIQDLSNPQSLKEYMPCGKVMESPNPVLCYHFRIVLAFFM